MPHVRSAVLLSTAGLASLAIAPAADAATGLTIRGGGFGHGVGMSQYGALGFAQHGKGYREILGHYYSGTQLGRLDADPTVRVLLQSRPRVTFTGAVQAGDRSLHAGRTYAAAPAGGGRVALLTASGRRVATFDAPLRATGPRGGALRVVGGENSGFFRGTLEVRPAVAGGLLAINAVGLEDYVRGVVGAESPASWPAEALRAQAVAARTYAITTTKDGEGFDHYADTRSQVYRGVAIESPSTDAAVSSTAGQVVTYQGRPVVTYFFSTSGGRTENAEFGFIGGPPSPWLTSVRDPYDSVSPRHRWTFRFSMAGAEAKLGGLVKGRFRRIEVRKRGRSPRVVRAVVVGSRGRTTVDGATLRSRFGLYDSWAYFRTIGTRVRPRSPGPRRAGQPSTGAMQANAASVRDATLHGHVTDVRRGTRIAVERRNRAGAWTTEVRTHVGRRGRYAATVTRTGTYRVRLGRMTGPRVRVR